MEISDILSAFDGVQEMLKACFGGPEEERAPPLETFEAFMSAFGGKG